MKRSRRVDEASAPRPPANLRTLITQYRACPTHSKPPSFLAFVRARNPHVFSHHAHDQPKYLDHVWRVGGLYLCRGCTTVIAVTPLALGLALITRWPVTVPLVATASIFVALLLLSLTPLRDGPRTLLHDLRRVALGCLLGSAAAYVWLCNDWLLRVVVVGVYLAVLAGRRLMRAHAARPRDADR